jgi:putative nucleotidyltransferase with HDIG domain
MTKYKANIQKLCNYEHSKQVAYISVHLGYMMKLSIDELYSLYWGGLFHDIGKVNIDLALLQKKDLDAAEMQEIRSHVKQGLSIFQGLFDTENKKKDIKDIIRYHHERQDGQGYPFQLQGNEIPLLTKIIQISDVYDAITADRKYRQKKNEKQAFDEIEKCTSSQFDSDIFYQFSKLYRNTNIFEKKQDLQYLKVFQEILN